MKRALLAAVMSLAAASLGAHSFHATLAEVEFNEESKRVEIAIRLFTDDLEKALSARAGKNVRLDLTEGVDASIAAYLRSNFVLRDDEGREVELRWVGRESDARVTWVYVDGPLPARATRVSIQSSLLVELFEDQVNSVNIRRAGKRSGLTFTRGDRAKVVE